jgi:Fe-S-cluster-containing hydrogenase component 2
VGFVSIDRPELDDQRDTILAAWPQTRTLISLVCRMNREPVRNPARSIANLEFHATTEQVNLVTRDLVRRLDDLGIAALNPSAGFPMEMSQFPGKIWVVSHKPVAVAAGLGQMGIHRNVIHPKFGNFIILGTVLLAVDVDLESRPIDYNPCLECKLCVAACPVGAIKPDGQFDPSACLTHNYREFMSGFTDWVEQVADSPSAASYRQRVTDSETASLWQSLSFGANYKAAYCLAVCPAGEDVIAPFLANRSQFLEAQLKPLQEKLEPVYVVRESDAEEHVKKRFPHKTVRPVGGVLPTSIEGFLSGMHIVFQAGKSRGLDCVYHFTFTGREPAQATVTIRNQTVTVERGLVGKANCRIVADSTTWMGFLRKERNIVWAILRRQVRVWGGLGKLIAFGKCFPS